MFRHVATQIPAAALSLVLVACSGGSNYEIDPYERPDTDDDTTPTYEMITVADVAAVRVGEQASVRCLLMDGNSSDLYLPDQAVAVDITPSAEVTIAGNHATFTAAENAIAYQVACRTADGELADGVGVRIDVLGLLPSSWTVDAPAEDCYSSIDRLELNYRATDSMGHEVRDVEIAATVSPSTGVLGNKDVGFRFTEDGTYTLTVEVVSQVDPAGDIAPQSFEVIVDATPPVVEITSPARGDALQAGGYDDMPVAVTGTVHDGGTAITTLMIDGVPQAITGTSMEEPIAATHPSRWGLSVVSAYAEDACGNVGYASVPFLRSPSYYVAATSQSLGARVSGALEAQVSQDFVDDGDRSDVDDLATLAETIVDGFDFDSMLAPGGVLSSGVPRDDCTGFPGPTFVSTGHVARRHPSASRAMNLGATIDHLTFVNGGIDFDARIDNFDFPLQVDVTIIQCAVGAPTIDQFTVDAWVGLDRLGASGIVGLNLEGGQPRASVEALAFDVAGLYLDIDCGAFDGACDTFSDAVMGAAEAILKSKVADAAAAMLPPVLEKALGGITIAKAMALPAPLDMVLNISATLDDLTFCGPDAGMPRPSACGAHNTSPGSVGFSLDTQIYPSARGARIPYDAPGAMRSEAVSPQFDTSSTAFGVGIRPDALNQALWALWYGGALSIPDVSAAMPDLPEGMEMSLNVALPPVIMPGENGNLIELGLGGLEIVASVNVTPLLGDPEGEPYIVDATMSISAVVGIGIHIDPETNALSLLADPEPEFWFDITEINDYTYGAFLGERFARLLSDGLAKMLSTALPTIDIPSFDLGGMAGLPAGTVWGLSHAQLTNENGYVALSGVIGPL